MLTRNLAFEKNKKTKTKTDVCYHDAQIIQKTLSQVPLIKTNKKKHTVSKDTYREHLAKSRPKEKG